MLYIVLLAYPIPYVLTHVTALPIYRLALDPLLYVLAAYAVVRFISGGRVGREGGTRGAADEPDDLALRPLR